MLIRKSYIWIQITNIYRS